MGAAPKQDWKAETYEKHAHFVPALGQAVLDLLAPKAGERILDLACGDGILTVKIAATGASVYGVDGSADMIKAANARGIEARVMDGMNLQFHHEFDAVFSNAALHWMKADPDAVIRGVAHALKPGGRFVAEMGGHGCVAAITLALVVAIERRGIANVATRIPWYFPTVDDYRGRLERAGFAVDYIALIPRPTPLPTDMSGWIQTFGDSLLQLLPAEARAAARDEAVELLRPVLCDEQGRWTADYMRLRFAAHLPG
ncbi:MAG TPA: methyltransferase domain-containing protein [Candidatus Binataceae bacterium]|nr:methyltransferase domain-containing protein [Candidatus Binataceae bacterium]